MRKTLLLALVLRLYALQFPIHFGDMDWFFASAYNALHTGHLPVLGITSSITWLHQGPLWTYFLLLPVQPVVLALVLGLFTVALAYISLGPIGGVVMAITPLAISQSITPYHTLLVPLFFFLALACAQRRHSYLTGLFVGCLYLSHLLTFIYWPLFIYLAWKHKLNFGRYGLGFVLGILPFIIAGPVQTLGIFVWLAKQLLTGFAGTTSSLSTAYQVVLLPGIVVVLKWIYAYGYSFGQKRKY